MTVKTENPFTAEACEALLFEGKEFAGQHRGVFVIFNLTLNLEAMTAFSKQVLQDYPSLTLPSVSISGPCVSQTGYWARQTLTLNQYNHPFSLI